MCSGEIVYTATISNSSGDYFISSNTSLLNNGKIICNSEILCSIQCIIVVHVKIQLFIVGMQ